MTDIRGRSEAAVEQPYDGLIAGSRARRLRWSAGSSSGVGDASRATRLGRSSSVRRSWSEHGGDDGDPLVGTID